MIYNRIPVAFGGLKKVTGSPINYQYDVTQILVISGLALPEYYEVDFCNEGDAQSITMVGTADGVAIPDEFLQTGKKVKAYIVIQGEDEGAVETRYEITIPVNPRPRRTDIEPTPAEQLQIDELVEALNDGVRKAEQGASLSGWVTFYIDSSGYLHYVKTANCDLDFYIDADGYLHVTNGVRV